MRALQLRDRLRARLEQMGRAEPAGAGPEGRPGDPQPEAGAGPRLREFLVRQGATLRLAIGAAPGRWAALAGAAVALLLLVLYLTAPYRTLGALRDALRQADGASVAQTVDLPSVTTSLREQVQGQLAEAEAAAPQPGTGAAVVGRVGPSVAQTLVAPLIERLATPEGLAEFLRIEASPARDLVRIANGPPSPMEAPAAWPDLAPASWLERVESRGFRSPVRFEVELTGGWTLQLRPSGPRDVDRARRAASPPTWPQTVPRRP